MNQDQVKGQLKKIKGEAEDVGGSATGDLSEHAKGKLDKGMGHVQKEYGDMKERVRQDPGSFADAISPAMGPAIRRAVR